MTALFYGSAAVALVSTVLAVTRTNLVHALMYVVMSFLASALLFASLGAPFVAAVEVIIYAGAVIVLFVVVVMLIGGGPQAQAREQQLLARRWVPLAVLGCGLLAAELAAALGAGTPGGAPISVPAADVARALFGPYAAAVELTSLLLLAGLAGALRLGARESP